MDDDPELAAFLGASIYARSGSSAFGPVPRRGENRQFDEYCEQLIDDEVKDDRETLHEMRRALWATWRTEAPRTREVPQGRTEDDEDAQLARALAESARESRGGSSRQSPVPILDDDEDAELQRAIAASEEESRAAKKRRRESTPEEERRMLEEALAASMADNGDAVPAEAVSDDEEIERANEAFKASREAFRDEERRRREARTQAPASNNAAKASLSRLTSTSAALSSTSSNTTSALPAEAETSATATPSLSRGILGDRAQMEQERLARVAARQNAQAGPSTHRQATAASTPRSNNVATLSDFRGSDVLPTRSAYNGQTANGGSSSRLPDNPHHPLQSAQPFPKDAAGEYFLDGELRNTHVDTQMVGLASERTFSLKQVIGNKNQIALIIMSSYVIADEWMETMLPPAEEVPRIVARPHPKEFPQWNGKVQAQDSTEVRCYPLMAGEYGSAHMKFFWIFYKTGRLRIAISTANMVDYDWDFIENSIFVQDFLQDGSPSTSSSTPAMDNQFAIQFRTLFLHLKVHKALRFLIDQHPSGSSIPLRPDDGFADMVKWDWTRVKVKLVMSIPGTYTGADKMEEFGIARLGKVLNESGWKPRPGEVVKAEFQNSSLGNYAIDWVDNFYQYCNGKSTRALTGRPRPTAFPPIKIVFPSLATVDSSILGRDGGGTMFCGRGFNSVTRKLFCDANSKRGGVMMHAKILIATFEPRSNDLGLGAVASSFTASPARKRKAEDIAEEDEGVGGWVYVGSHNFSPAAWGTANLKKNPPTLNVRNYEMGIVFPLPRLNANKAADAIAPHHRPPRPYGLSDVPWDQKLQAQGESPS